MPDILAHTFARSSSHPRRWENISILDFYRQTDGLPCPRIAISSCRQRHAVTPTKATSSTINMALKLIPTRDT
jgi:hypothetical protein